MKRFLRSSLKLLPAPCLAIGLSSQALSQVTAIEPNNPCEAAQDVGPIDATGTFSVQGSLDTPPEEPDVDFFRFSATPGAQLVADDRGAATGMGTLSDPFLGLFDSDCNLLASNDDAGGTLNSRLRFDVPSDGVFILAATSCCDDQFNGSGGSSGTYVLTIAPPPPSIGSISGRIVDAVTGDPLPGNEPPFAFAELFRCEDGNCFALNSQNADGEGRFRFEQDFEGQPLPVGTYQVRAFANEFDQAETDPFEVGEGEDFDVGDIPLQPPPISVSDIQPCEDLLPQGDICRYSLQLNNNTDAPVRGLAWSIVVGSRLTLHSIRGQHAGRVKAGCSRASRLRAARQRDRGVSV